MFPLKNKTKDGNNNNDKEVNIESEWVGIDCVNSVGGVYFP